MSATDDGGPAFPIGSIRGMSLRDYFAAVALPSVIQVPFVANPAERAIWFAQRSYQIADAMLAERAK